VLIEFLSRSRMLEFLAGVGVLRSLSRRARPQARRAKAHRAEFYRRAWELASEELGATVHLLEGDLLEISRDENRVRVFRNYTPLDDPVTLRVAGNKPLVHRLLAEAGLPVTEHRVFRLRQISEAVTFMADAPGPCVVKPAGGTGAGQGVTTGIRKRSQLLRAVVGTGVSPRAPLLIEQEVPGDNYRLLFLDGLLLDAVRRRPPSVTGDGSSTVRRLVRAANQERLDRGYDLAQTILEIDRDMRQTLARQDLSLESVPPAESRVILKTAINSNSAAENESVTDELHEAVVEASAKAAAIVGARLAGVDIITSDLARPLEEVGGVILEVNTTPGFHFHYQTRGEAFPVAERVLECALSTLGVPPKG
jgi:D-alanine-D-alanine ligase-like ATP-grasp enzyme